MYLVLFCCFWLQTLRENAQNKSELALFKPEQTTALGLATITVSKSRNKHLVDLFKDGYDIFQMIP